MKWQQIKEAVGRITKQNQTVDVGADEIKKQAAKFGNIVDRDGRPPTMSKRVKGSSTNILYNLGLSESKTLQEHTDDQDLVEIDMSPSSLSSWAKSTEGMMAGFEAELIFANLGDEGEMEPDYDEDTRAGSLEEIIDFFDSGPYGGLSSRETRNIIDSYSEKFHERLQEIVDDRWDQGELIYYIENNDEFDRDAAREQAEEELGDDAEEMRIEERIAELFDEFVESVWDEGPSNSVFERAYEAFTEETAENYTIDDFIASERVYMSDVEDEFGLQWPYMTEDEDKGFSEESAERLADELESALGVSTRVSTGYHAAPRDDKTWIFEPDSSIDVESGDMGVEIVSPPMPLSQTLEILPKFFDWAKKQGASTDVSTGFHMSVSLPDHRDKYLDYTKLALLLGDRYVLDQFDRFGNYYAESALKKIRDLKDSNDRALTVLDQMRNKLNEYSTRALANSQGFGKYFSINPKGGYIEFRSAGGYKYFDNVERLQATLLRYARATAAAMDPEDARKEYATKLYKMLTDTETQQVTDPRTGRKRTQVKQAPEQSNDVIWLFSQYSSGQLDKKKLAASLKQLQQTRSSEKRLAGKLPPKDDDGNYEVFSRRTGASMYTFNAEDEDAAVDALNLWRKYFANRINNFKASNYDVRPAKTEKPAAGPDEEDQLLPFKIIYSVGQDNARGTYRVDARNREEARRIFMAKVRDAGYDTDNVYTWEIDQLGSN